MPSGIERRSLSVPFERYGGRMTRVRRIDPYVIELQGPSAAIGWIGGYSTNEATSSRDFRLRSGTTQSSAG